MKTLIYQYWDGSPTTGNSAGSAAMKKYAETIGSDYIYEDNPKFITTLGKYSPHYGAFKPILTNMSDGYDYILFADTDVFPVEHLSENIFEQFYNYPKVEIGICEEWQQPEIRKKYPGPIDNINDEKWISWIQRKWASIKMPRTETGLPTVYNSGVVVYSALGIQRFKKSYLDFETYVRGILQSNLNDFYTGDQNYLNLMLQLGNFDYRVMDYKWNNSVHYTPGTSGTDRPVTDLRVNPNFVHVQLRGADHFSAEKLSRIVNFPVTEWNLNG